VVSLEKVLVDVLPELARAQLLDELGAEEDADQEGGDPPDEDLA
jgi:hypothetical protein